MDIDLIYFNQPMFSGIYLQIITNILSLLL